MKDLEIEFNCRNRVLPDIVIDALQTNLTTCVLVNENKYNVYRLNTTDPAELFRAGKIIARLESKRVKK